MKRLTDILTTLTALLLLSACSLEDIQCDEEAERPSVNEVYVNFTITNNGSSASALTRADWWPRGGEHGNFNEAAFQRESEVTGVTLILYQTTDGLGLNTAEDPVLDFVRYYPVRETIFPSTQGGGGNWESAYTTGQQALGKHRLDFEKTYHVLAFVNVYPIGLTEGESKLSDIKDATLHTLYMGTPQMYAHECHHYVMCQENNANTIRFYATVNVGTTDDPVYEDQTLLRNMDGTAYTGGDMYYDLTNNTIEVERTTARMDFWAVNSEGYKTSADNAAYKTPGYEYVVYDNEVSQNPTADRFVITHITPFNLNNGQEYYFKHLYIKDSNEDPLHLSRLATEDGFFRSIVDPATGKDLSSSTKSVGDYLNPLSGITDDNIKDNPYRHAVSVMHGQVSDDHGTDGKSGGFSDCKETYHYNVIEGGVNVEKEASLGPAEDIIIGYAMENCLPQNASLYNYATGIVLEGDYYVNGTGTPTRRVYYGFMRHASRTNSPDSYPALTSADFDTAAKREALVNYDADDVTGTMLFGVVRNSLYRVHVDKVYQRGGMKLTLKVKKWDKFKHKEIIM